MKNTNNALWFTLPFAALVSAATLSGCVAEYDEGDAPLDAPSEVQADPEQETAEAASAAAIAGAAETTSSALPWSCYDYSGYLTFTANTPWHIDPYGSSRVVSRGGGRILVTHVCENDYGNIWFRSIAGYYAWENYLN